MKITYAIHDEGYVVSRVGNELAWPVLDFAQIGKGGRDKHPNTGIEHDEYQPGNFNGPMRYNLGKISVFDYNALPKDWQELEWTKKIPTGIKNYHRKFWGMKPLKEKQP